MKKCVGNRSLVFNLSSMLMPKLPGQRCTHTNDKCVTKLEIMPPLTPSFSLQLKQLIFVNTIVSSSISKRTRGYGHFTVFLKIYLSFLQSLIFNIKIQCKHPKAYLLIQQKLSYRRAKTTKFHVCSICLIITGSSLRGSLSDTTIQFKDYTPQHHAA